MPSRVATALPLKTRRARSRSIDSILTIEDLLAGSAQPRHPGALIESRPQKRRVQLAMDTGQGDLFMKVTRGEAGEVVEISQHSVAQPKQAPVSVPEKRPHAANGRRRRVA